MARSREAVNLDILHSRAERASRMTSLCVSGVIGLCVASMLVVVLLTWISPGDDHTLVFATVFGLVAPLATALLAATLRQLELAVNSRMTQMVALQAKASHAEGVLSHTRDVSGHALTDD